MFTYSLRHDVFWMNLTGGVHTGWPVPVQNNPIAVDYDPIQRHIFWTERHSGVQKIYRYSLADGGIKAVDLSRGMKKVWLQKKKSWFSSAPSSNFYNKKRAMLLVNYSVLGNTRNAYIFLMIWYFRSPSSFFNFFLLRTKTFIFQFQKKKKKKKIACPRHFSLMRTKTFIFRGLTQVQCNSS